MMPAKYLYSARERCGIVADFCWIVYSRMPRLAGAAVALALSSLPVDDSVRLPVYL